MVDLTGSDDVRKPADTDGEVFRDAYGAPRRSRSDEIHAAHGFTLRLLLSRFTITIFLAKDTTTKALGLTVW